MTKAKFPAFLKVVVDENDDSNPPGHLVYSSTEEAISDDGPTDVATYQRIDVRKFRKTVVEVGKK